jgi:hypothetical protein
MRTAQISIHAKLFNDRQLSKDFIEEHGTIYDVHSYCDSNNFCEALLSAVVDVYQKAQDAHGREYASRRDLVTSIDRDPGSARMARGLEPSRPIDIRDMQAIAKHFEEQGKTEVCAVVNTSAAIEKRVLAILERVTELVNSDEYKHSTPQARKILVHTLETAQERLQDTVNIARENM